MNVTYNLDLSWNDCEDILIELDKVHIVYNDTDLSDINTPILQAFTTWLDSKNLKLSNIDTITYPIEYIDLGVAILTHFKSYKNTN